MNDLFFALIHGRFCLYIFFWGCNKEANHKIRFPPRFIYLFIFPANCFICKFGFIIKDKCKRGSALSEWADFW